ncbi:hypothetical protein MKW94_018411 [Papaver nudicaule]|uniref:Uncharacterized protein n=1 Tax=Papaver nudicaule TaxID=74823 RepID=A0AA41V421_PAPNU|nr:hypothetical protein [Papaver nudicaule]
MIGVLQDHTSSEELDEDKADKCRNGWLRLLWKIWALEPRHVGPSNILLVPEAKVENDGHSVLIRSSPLASKRLGFVDEKTSVEDKAFENSVEHLGSMYAVLSKRRARVLKEEMHEGSSLFTVHAYVPVTESFGLHRSFEKRHLELQELSEVPFFVPKTEEEIEEFGDGTSVLPNTARKLIDAVRRRKGLPVEGKVVQHATKQRTLARKV